VSDLEFRVGGETRRLSATAVRSALKGEQLGPIRLHAVEVDGVLYPIKEAFAKVTGLDLLDFNTNQARRIFRKLGFPVTRR